jgi:hypothetical protein
MHNEHQHMNEEEFLTPKIQRSLKLSTRMEDLRNRYFVHERIK